MDIRKVIKEVELLIRNTGDFIRKEVGKVENEDIETKAMNSLVSYVDKNAEVLLVKGLSEILPNSGFITEEDTPDNPEKSEVWIIDPLDGTTNFLRQIPHFSISVALEVDGTVVLGFVYNIMLDELFSAGLEHGAYMNGKPISVAKTALFSEAIIATGFPYEKKETAPFTDVLQELMLKARGLRRFGSAALDLVYVATGRLDAYYECCLNKWDVAAGILIVREAGGIVTDFNGGDNVEYGKQIIAASPTIHPPLLHVIQSNKVLA